MNFKKLSLGFLSVMTLTMVLNAPVYAAENAMDGTGASTVTYSPGKATGGDGDGNVSSWTVDYPVKIVLSDANVNHETGVEMNFKALNTGTENLYTEGANIKVSLKKHPNSHGAKQIWLQDENENIDTTNNLVRMRVSRSTGSTVGTGVGTDITTNQETHFATLSKSNQIAKVRAYLSDHDGVNGKSYHTTLTWKFHSEAY